MNRNKAMMRCVRYFATVLALVSLLVSPAEASLSRRSVLVYDANTNRVIYEQDGYAERFPASLTKMMTLYMLFDALSTGKVTFNTRMRASKYAASQPQTNLSMRSGDTISVGQAINAMVIRSANDVAVVIAEHLGGNTANFAAMMTRKARALGMKNTVFKNPNGLPDPRQHTTAMDLALLGVALRKHFPQYYHAFSAQAFSYKGKLYTSHNRVLGKLPGIDGIKTGFINASGFNLVTSLKRGDINIVAVIMGGTTAAERDAQMVSLMKRTYTTMVAAQSKKGDNAVTQVAEVNAPIPIAKPAFPEVSTPAVQMAAAPTANESQRMLVTTTPATSTLQTTPPSPPVSIRFTDTPMPESGNTASISLSTASSALAQKVIRSAHTLEYQFASYQVANNGKAASNENIMPKESNASVAEIEPVDTSTTPNNWAVQIGVYSDKATARKALSTAAIKVRPALSTAIADVEYAEQANRSFHRARFTNLARDEANTVCQKLQRLHQDCFVTRMN
jgi:D-alanyl-D-alanine carboxypeptidase